MNTGIHDISMADYIADPCAEPSLSKTTVKKIFEQSLLHAHCFHPRLGGLEGDDSSAADKGSYAHDLLTLGDDRLVEMPFDNFRTKIAQEARDEAYAAGKIPLLSKDIGEIRGMTGIAESVLDKVAPNRLTEKTIIFQRESWIRTRPDFIDLESRLVVEYKTTSNASPKDWSKLTIPRGGYDIQCAMQLMGAESITGKPFDYLWLVQETKAPYAVSLIRPSGQLRSLGEQKIMHADKLWAQALKTGCFPGYEGVYEADASVYQLADVEERML